MRAACRRLSQAVEGREPWLDSVSAAAVLVSLGLLSEKALGFTVAEEFLEAGFAGVVLALVVRTRGLEAVTLCFSQGESGDSVRFAAAGSPSEEGAEGAEVDDRRFAGQTRRSRDRRCMAPFVPCRTLSGRKKTRGALGTAGQAVMEKTAGPKRGLRRGRGRNRRTCSP